MLAAVLKKPDRLVLEDVPVPDPGLGEAVIRIKACGLCATDYKAIKGIRTNVTFPLVPGHEPSGVVAKVGPGTIHFREGDEVISPTMNLPGFGETDPTGLALFYRHQEEDRQVMILLSDTEDKIAYARQFYNRNVLSYNTKVQTVPTAMIAGLFGFAAEEFFEADEASREDVEVSFTTSAPTPPAAEPPAQNN